jgi:uncharacterized PurR-regulated membrane protein YhhQ (DUF165 family)
MANKTDLTLRVRVAGLFAAIIAVAAMAVAVLADNHNGGFGHTVTRGEQMFRFVIASLLLVAQTIAYLIDRARRRTKHGTERTMTVAPGAKVRPWGKI